MPKVALLANPDSGSGDADAVEREIAALEISFIRLGLDEADALETIAPARVVVAGGDGSIGCAAEAASRLQVPLGVVPIGTANDFARALALPDELAKACETAALGSRTRWIELGRMDRRPFVNVASLGLPPAAAWRASGLKRKFGPLAYAVGGVRAAAFAHPVWCRLADDAGDELFAGEAWQATIACSGHFGGGSQVDADPSDGLLDAVVVQAGSRLRLVLRARGMRAGTLEEQDGVHKRRAPAFTLDVGPETSFNVDGELCVRSGEVRFTVDADAVEVVVG